MGFMWKFTVKVVYVYIVLIGFNVSTHASDVAYSEHILGVSLVSFVFMQTVYYEPHRSPSVQ